MARKEYTDPLVNRGWSEMEEILDREMPVRGNRGYYFILFGGCLLVLLSLFYWTLSQNDAPTAVEPQEPVANLDYTIEKVPSNSLKKSTADHFRPYAVASGQQYYGSLYRNREFIAAPSFQDPTTISQVAKLASLDFPNLKLSSGVPQLSLSHLAFSGDQAHEEDASKKCIFSKTDPFIGAQFAASPKGIFSFSAGTGLFWMENKFWRTGTALAYSFNDFGMYSSNQKSYGDNAEFLSPPGEPDGGTPPADQSFDAAESRLVDDIAFTHGFQLDQLIQILPERAFSFELSAGIAYQFVHSQSYNINRVQSSSYLSGKNSEVQNVLNWSYGLGLRYRFSEHYSALAQWKHSHMGMEDNYLTQYLPNDYHQFGLGLRYHL